MSIDGLAEFLEMLKNGGDLADFDLLSVDRLGADNDGAERYSVTIGYGPLHLVVSSWMPAKGVRKHILRLAQEVGDK